MTATLATCWPPCDEDYTPCSCEVYNTTGQKWVYCFGVTPTQVAEVFSRTPTVDLEALNMFLSVSEVLEIPANLMGNSRALDLTLYGPSEGYPLKIHPDAFRSTRNYTTLLEIEYYDMSQLNMAFLTGFNQLGSMFFGNVFNLPQGLSSLPPLPSLWRMYIGPGCTGLEDWLAPFPKLARGLEDLHLMGQRLDEAAIGRILYWLLESSTNTLSTLTLDGQQMAMVPTQISSFTKLSNLEMIGNSAPFTLQSRSLTFTSDIRWVEMSYSKIDYIEPGAFQGIIKWSLAHN